MPLLPIYLRDISEVRINGRPLIRMNGRFLQKYAITLIAPKSEYQKLNRLIEERHKNFEIFAFAKT